ncbi:MAG: hypothetical protein EA356_16705 [Geminicoccaceae bacterium]|nr:MAG: hypothetical protein EA356_16705 [Geminicoccaceae bacterium]
MLSGFYKKSLLSLVGALAILAGGGCAGGPAETVVDNVGRLHLDGFLPGDRVRVHVEGHPELSREYQLDHDGALELPLLGRVDAYGVTPAELEKVLVLGFGDGFLRAPEVTVRRARHRPIFVAGEVVHPGSYAFEPGLTAAAAVTRAGGAAGEPETLRIFVIRAGAGDAVSAHTPLQPGDVVELRRSAG